MAIQDLPQPPRVNRLHQERYIDSVRWLPSLSPFQKSAIIAFFDTDTDCPSLGVHTILNHEQETLTPISSWTAPSRISALRSTASLVAAATFSGSLHVFSAAECLEPSVLEPQVSVPAGELHLGTIGGVDLMEGGSDVLCVGEDGRVNLVALGAAGFSGGKGSYRKVIDGNGLVSYTAVKWASPSEFVTGGCGFGLQWWDLRDPGSAVAHFKGNWDKGATSGIIHSVDIHPSRKHTCLAGGSSGTVFAWDMRWPQTPILLSGVGISDTRNNSLSESEVWEVQYDYYIKSSNSNMSSSRILPSMICSEDGILAVIEQGEEPAELLAEPCAINSFDIDRQNPTDVICSLEWESIVLLSRP